MGLALAFRHFRLPGDVNTVLDGLIRGTQVGIDRQGSLRFLFHTGGSFERIGDPDLCDCQDALFLANISFHLGYEVFSGRNSPRIQRGAESAGQSAGNSCDDVIQGGRIFRALDFPSILLLIEILYAPVDAEVNGFREIFDVGRSVGSLMFVNADVAGVG